MTGTKKCSCGLTVKLAYIIAYNTCKNRLIRKTSGQDYTTKARKNCKVADKDFLSKFNQKGNKFPFLTPTQKIFSTCIEKQQEINYNLYPAAPGGAFRHCNIWLGAGHTFILLTNRKQPVPFLVPVAKLYQKVRR
jgi:hypothetical protein